MENPSEGAGREHLKIQHVISQINFNKTNQLIYQGFKVFASFSSKQTGQAIEECVLP